ncbi:MAG: aminotransferase class IV [Bacteroidales bacterium]
MITRSDSVQPPMIFESIRIELGAIQYVEYHNLRLNRSRKQLYHCTDIIRLESIIDIPSHARNGNFKCRVIFSGHLHKIEFQPYTPRVVKSIIMIESDHMDYSHKYLDRSAIDDLFSQRGDADDILIIRNGYVTDTSYANIVFWNGRDWITPSTPLLNGTARQRLLQEGKILQAELKPKDISNFLGFKLINAMLDFDDQANQIISTGNIQ